MGLKNSTFGCQRDLILKKTYFNDLLPHHFTNNNNNYHQINWLYWTCSCLCCNGRVLCLSLLCLCFQHLFLFVLVYYPFLLIQNTLAVWENLAMDHMKLIKSYSVIYVHGTAFAWAWTVFCIGGFFLFFYIYIWIKFYWFLKSYHWECFDWQTEDDHGCIKNVQRAGVGVNKTVCKCPY